MQNVLQNNAATLRCVEVTQNAYTKSATTAKLDVRPARRASRQRPYQAAETLPDSAAKRQGHRHAACASVPSRRASLGRGEGALNRV